MRVVGTQQDIFRMEAEAAWKRSRQEEAAAVFQRTRLATAEDEEEDKDVNVIDDDDLANNRPQKTLKIRARGTTGYVLDDKGQIVNVVEDFIDPEDDDDDDPDSEEEACDFCQKYTVFASGPSIFVNMYRVRHGGSCEDEKIPEERLLKYRVRFFLNHSDKPISLTHSLGVRRLHGEEL